MKPICYISCLPLLLLIFGSSCKSQTQEQIIGKSKTKLVGGKCEGCETMYVGMPGKIEAVDTSLGWYEEGQKLLVKGTVYKIDGKTPAPGVIVYYYHTDNSGNYTKRNDKPEYATRHGHIRGWIKTKEDGNYAFYTIRPAAYPGHTIPSHIHVMVKEPGINEYYIDEFVFDDDPILTKEQKAYQEKRGGDGILKVSVSGNMQVAEHNIILGLNIPDYPAAK